MTIDNVSRRSFIKVSAGVVTLASCQNLLAFQNLPATTQIAIDNRLLEAYHLDSSYAVVDNKIRIKAPMIAENGAEVPILVMSEYDDIESIMIFAIQNPDPFVSKVEFSKYSDSFYRNRIRIRRTSDILVFAKTQTELLFNKIQVKVTIAGCGG